MMKQLELVARKKEVQIVIKIMTNHRVLRMKNLINNPDSETSPTMEDEAKAIIEALHR